MSFTFELSTKNFKEASKVNGNDEFCFIIGKEKICCHKFVAAFLSRSVCQQLISDSTTNSFDIDYVLNKNNSYRNTEIEKKIKACLESLIIGTQIEITNEELEKFNEDLQKMTDHSKLNDFSSTTVSSLIILNEILNNDEMNEELYRKIFTSITKKKKSINQKSGIEQEIKHLQQIEHFFNMIKSIKKINKKQNENMNFNFNYNYKQYLLNECKEIIDEIASHFNEIDDNNFNEMNEYLIELVLSSQKLQIESEDSLLNKLLNRRKYILSTNCNDDEKRFFIEQIQFEYLTESTIEQFLNEFELNNINEQIWEGIKKRLILPVKIEASNNKRVINKTFSYNSQNPFNGIIQYLTQKTNGNIHTNKTIEITCSKLCCGKIETLVNLNDSMGHTHVNGSPTPRWLQIDFKERKIEIDSYLIKSCDVQSYSDICALKSWKIEISKDGNSWETIDSRENVPDLNGDSKMQIFNISKKNEPSRFFRIITDKDNWYNYDGFVISKLELFGRIIE